MDEEQTAETRDESPASAGTSVDATGTETGASTPPSPSEGAEAGGAAGRPTVESHESGKRERRSRGDRTARPRRRDAVLFRAHRAGLPLEGRVEKVIKGGYEIRISKSRGFCPHSQMDIHRVDDPEHWVGQTLPFKVMQVRRGGEDVIVSRREVLEEARSEEAKAVRATLIEGAITRGKVVRIAAFGVFVDLGAGVTGLVHVSELSHSRVGRITDVVNVDDWVSVKILKLEESSGRISLSVRQSHENPWDRVGTTYREGHVYPGMVTRLADFGAFVELEPGVEALAPVRELPPTPGDWKEGLAPGTKKEWLVLAVDAGRRRISVIPAPEGEAPQELPRVEAGAHLRGKVQKVESFGVFVWLRPGSVGLVPNVWTGIPRGADMASKFAVGSDIAVEVVEVADHGRRIRLAVEGKRRQPETPRQDRPKRSAGARRPEPAPEQPSSSFGNSMADALRAALDKRDAQS